MTTSRFYVHTEPSIKTLGPVTFAVDVPSPSDSALLSFLGTEMARNLRVDKSRLSFVATGPIDFLVKVH
jgi:hypothetical protein